MGAFVCAYVFAFEHARVFVSVCVCLHASHLLQNIGQFAEDVHGLGLQGGNTGGGDVRGIR